MASPNVSTSPAAGELTVAHVTNTLGQIESWIGAVRVALGGLAPGTALAGMKGPSPLEASIQRVQKSCPPPKKSAKKTPKKK